MIFKKQSKDFESLRQLLFNFKDFSFKNEVAIINSMSLDIAKNKNPFIKMKIKTRFGNKTGYYFYSGEPKYSHVLEPGNKIIFVGNYLRNSNCLSISFIKII